MHVSSSKRAETCANARRIAGRIKGNRQGKTEKIRLSHPLGRLNVVSVRDRPAYFFLFEARELKLFNRSSSRSSPEANFRCAQYSDLQRVMKGRATKRCPQDASDLVRLFVSLSLDYLTSSQFFSIHFFQKLFRHTFLRFLNFITQQCDLIERLSFIENLL